MKNSKPKTVYVLCGPTAVGKTAIAIGLAGHLHTSIISADSRQCYQGMTIGTAQPSIEERSAVKHYFIDEFPVTQNISAADYEQLALGYLEDIFLQHDTAIVCGGTGLYIRALCEGLDEMPATDGDIEKTINDNYAINGLPWLQERLKEEDPLFYAQAETHNPARLLRALIFKRSTGKSISDFRSGQAKTRPFNIIKIGLELPREELYTRINRRVDMMMQEGLLEEVKQLIPYQSLKNLQTVGYTELFSYLNNDCALPEAIEKIKQHTRNYAKRQMTWFKKDKTITWLAANDPDVIDKIIKA